MIVLVTGATGLLGWEVVEALVTRAHAVRAMSRARRPEVPMEATPISADLSNGRGLPDAVDGVDAIVHCATNPRSATSVDRDGTTRLIEVAERSGKPHLLFPSVVGCDVVPLRYYLTKEAAEKAVTASKLPWTIARFTQFHESVWNAAEAAARRPLIVVPAATRVQPLDVRLAATRIADTLEVGSSGRLPDLGGRQAFEVKALMRSYLAAARVKRRVLPINFPGIRGAALRAGGLLTENRAEAGLSWNEFVAGRMA